MASRYHSFDCNRRSPIDDAAAAGCLSHPIQPHSPTPAEPQSPTHPQTSSDNRPAKHQCTLLGSGRIEIPRRRLLLIPFLLYFFISYFSFSFHSSSSFYSAFSIHSSFFFYSILPYTAIYLLCSSLFFCLCFSFYPSFHPFFYLHTGSPPSPSIILSLFIHPFPSINPSISLESSVSPSSNISPSSIPLPSPSILPPSPSVHSVNFILQSLDIPSLSILNILSIPC